MTSNHKPAAPSGRYLLILSLGALGVVYGDIGTSPLYTIKECFHGTHAVAVTHDNILGILSLIIWSLVVVISVKYLAFVMRADNRGEGGILALMSLIMPKDEKLRKRRFALIAMGLFGAALLYGDGMITPAITVLSAVEGLEVATPLFKPYVLPLTFVILFLLFFVQRRGTGGIGAIFGPFMLFWFGILAAAGLWRLLAYPAVLEAFNPWWGVKFFINNGWLGFLSLGSVFLAVTGGEALYADMGHFGASPIRRAWFSLVLPALVLNYLGQGALLLRDPGAVENPFYRMFPDWAVMPMVAISAFAASIASQAVISGAFSLTRQAVQLGYSPRVAINHTSAKEIGQIYIPVINWVLMIATFGLVYGFGSATALASAYGVAVTTTMGITTILLFVVARELWQWSMWKAVLLCGVFLIPDLAFFGANILKVHDGGWFPLLVAAVIFTLMTTWRRGRQILDERLEAESLPLELFIESVAKNPPTRVRGTAVFMFRNPVGTPTALLHNLKHNKVLHERTVLMTVNTEEVPHISDRERIRIVDMGNGIYRMMLRFGFMEDPDIPELLQTSDTGPLKFDPADTTYFLGRETLIATRRPGMALWREKLFAWMMRNARGAASFFRLPPNRVVELGAQIEL